MHKLKKDEIEQIITLYIYMFVIEIFFLILNNLIVFKLHELFKFKLIVIIWDQNLIFLYINSKFLIIMMRNNWI